MTDEYLRASIERALDGNTPDSLVEIRFQNGNPIVWEFVFDGPLDEDDRERVSIAETEMISDLRSGLTSESRWIEGGSGTPGYPVAFSRKAG